MKEFIFEVRFGNYAEQYKVFASNWTIARTILDDNILHAFPEGAVKDIAYIDTRPVVW